MGNQPGCNSMVFFLGFQQHMVRVGEFLFHDPWTYQPLLGLQDSTWRLWVRGWDHLPKKPSGADSRILGDLRFGWFLLGIVHLRKFLSPNSTRTQLSWNTWESLDSGWVRVSRPHKGWSQGAFFRGSGTRSVESWLSNGLAWKFNKVHKIYDVNRINQAQNLQMP